MKGTPVAAFRDYSPEDREDCLRIFDENCPEFFAPNERAEYAEYLGGPPGYEVCLLEGEVVGAFGLSPEAAREMSLRWILLSPRVQRMGLGSAVMARALSKARGEGASRIRISASHKSAPFFARFSAREISTTPNGWGPGMHRVEMEIVPGST